MVTERQRVEAVRQILRQLYTLEDQGMFPKYITRIERETIFFLYEHQNSKKWDMTRPHSAAARGLHETITGRIKSRSHGITYDHAIPLATLRPYLKKAIISTDAMHRILKRFVCAVIITNKEDTLLTEAHLRRKMPKGAKPDDRLARYRAVGIKFSAADESLLK
jgi:hypothetical protein